MLERIKGFNESTGLNYMSAFLTMKFARVLDVVLMQLRQEIDGSRLSS